jgi:hypothetical protein
MQRSQKNRHITRNIKTSTGREEVHVYKVTVQRLPCGGKRLRGTKMVLELKVLK